MKYKMPLVGRIVGIILFVGLLVGPCIVIGSILRLTGMHSNIADALAIVVSMLLILRFNSEMSYFGSKYEQWWLLRNKDFVARYGRDVFDEQSKRESNH